MYCVKRLLKVVFYYFVTHYYVGAAVTVVYLKLIIHKVLLNRLV